MKLARTLEEFYLLNDEDMDRILSDKFYQLLTYNSLEDLKADIYLKLQSSRYIEDYRPLLVEIDMKTGEWKIKSAAAKFSTYICKLIFNHLYAFHRKMNKYSHNVSLDEYNDSGYCDESKKKLEEFKNKVIIPEKSSDFTLQISQCLAKLEERKDTGNIVCDTAEEEVLVRYIEKKGVCSKKELLKNFSDLSVLHFSEQKKIVKKMVGKRGEDLFLIDAPLKRSLYNLFNLYLAGFRDKEISEKFKITVAGVGAMKRSLRKEIQRIIHGEI